MRITKALMVRKPSNFEEVLKITKKYIKEAENVIVEKTVKLTDAAYQQLIDNPMTGRRKRRESADRGNQMQRSTDLASQRRRVRLCEVHGNSFE